MTGSARIVVVDDEPDLRLLLEDYLGAQGLAVRTAGSGAELDALLRAEPADLLILDVNMPIEDGFAIVARLRAAGNAVGIVMLTAAGAVESRLAGTGRRCRRLPAEAVRAARAVGPHPRRAAPPGGSGRAAPGIARRLLPFGRCTSGSRCTPPARRRRVPRRP